jgi:hypothetical protein
MPGIKKQDYKDAITVQDACNLSGVVHSFSAIVSRIWEEARMKNEGTDWVNGHPICVLFASKIADLVGVRDVGYFKAWTACIEEVEKK